MKIITNERLVSLTPLLTTCLFETANVGQLIRMWTERTAAGQSVPSWLLVNIGLWLWLNFYRVKTPGEKIAILATKIGIVMNASVLLTAIYFRYVVGRG
jgi:uncharacterized protein with PQ loop repeat